MDSQHANHWRRLREKGRLPNNSAREGPKKYGPSNDMGIASILFFLIIHALLKLYFTESYGANIKLKEPNAPKWIILGLSLSKEQLRIYSNLVSTKRD